MLRRAPPLLGLALATGVFIYPAIAHGVDVWSTDEEFTYGFLIGPIALALAWRQRHAARRVVARGAASGLVVALGAAFVILLSRRLGINALGGVAVSPLLLGIVAYLFGWRSARTLAFPAFFLVFGLALYRGLLNSVGFTLQTFTAQGAGFLGQHLGLPVVQDGLVLQAPDFAFIVAQSCSGMSSLLSLLALSALWIHVTHGAWFGRLAIVLSVPVLVIIANTTRVTLVLVVANWLGQEAALGFFHGASSLVLFGLALAGLMLVSRLFRCRISGFAAQF
jgi:exosortase